MQYMESAGAENGRDEGREFLAYINRLREEKGYTLRQLCGGLCSHGTMEAMENGRWVPNKLLQDCILERLGVAAEDYIHILDYVEYEHWEARQHILHSITFGKAGAAAELLKKYAKVYGRTARLERQFYLAMHAQILWCQGCPERMLSGLYAEAVELTVPEPEKGGFSGRVLSVKELNLLLEAERYRAEGERPERYREIMEYIEGYGLDKVGMAKIYPKAVYLLCKSAVQEQKREDTVLGAEALLSHCGRAIEILRDSERMYYLWELLALQQQLSGIAVLQLERWGQHEKALAVAGLYKEEAEWKQVLEEVYAEWGVPKETYEFCYLYVMKGVYCVADVIRIRREMLGISQRELCRDICDIKTLRRLEKKERRTQRKVTEQLMGRLGLPREFTRTDLVTDSREARKLMSRLRWLVNRPGQWAEAEAVLARIRELVSMEIPCNRQVIKGKEAYIKWKSGRMETEKYLVRMQEVLEITLPYKIFLKKGEKYLTNEEQVCIMNWMQGMDEQSGECLTCMRRMEELYLPYIEKELWEVKWNMQEFVMGNVASSWGNRGEYDRADYYSGIILEGCLRFRRSGKISYVLYDRWWNHDMRKNQNIPVKKIFDDAEELKKCILFSVIVKDRNGEMFCRKKLDAVMKR